MIFAIAGVSGNTGKVAAEALLAQGKQVRVIVRDPAKAAAFSARGAEVAVADLSDAAALSAALRGVEGAYLLVPPHMTVPNFRAYQDAISHSLAQAVAESRVPHVVLLSSLGAQEPRGTGPIAGIHFTEQLLSRVEGTRVSALRAGYFLENLAPSLPVVREAGILPSFFPASLAFPMIGTRDIGRLAAQLLLEPPSASQVVQLGSPHSHAEIAESLGRLLGKPVEVQEAPLEAVVPTFTGFGMSADLAGLYAEMIGALRSGLVRFMDQERKLPGSDSLETVLRTLLG
jgi:uncharacterized protein YbjT (DUF2867 family)